MNFPAATKKRFSNTLDAWLGNLSKSGRSRKQTVAVSVDAILAVLSLWAAYSIRHGELFSDFKSTFHLFLIIPAGTVIIFMSVGIYRWVVRSSNDDLYRQLIKGCIAASALLILAMYLFPPERPNPRSLFFIFGMLLVLSTSGARYVWRMLFQYGNKGEPVAIYGCGVAGRQLLQSLTQGTEFRPVLFLDDNPALVGSMVGGLSVYAGDSEDTKSNLLGFEVERVILAMPSSNAADYQRQVDTIRELNITVQTIPSFSEIVSGKANLSEVRDVSITDILGRSEVPPSDHLLGKSVSGQNVLVTGGGGSIGSELCRQIIGQQPNTLVVMEQSEENLYHITEEFSKLAKSSQNRSTKFVPYLGSVTDKVAVADIFKEYAIQTVYHAAAYKHVPIVEAFPEQGVRVNIYGTLTVLEAAIKAKADRFTLISSDKAVRPANAMGATKRIAELILQAKAELPDVQTRINMVRFGNVLGSSGSVVPKFKAQIENGGPITLTHPDITRYFMTIPEAAQLVLQASAIAKGGDVFVLDMGKPVRIEDLAISMVKMSGKKLIRETGNPNDIDVVVEGLRPGEKMYEELFLSDNFEQTEVAKVLVADEDWLSWQELSKRLEQIQQNIRSGDRTALRSNLLALAFLKGGNSVNVARTVELAEDKVKDAANESLGSIA